ncbi:MAG: SAM-dependent methyltransferase, partial [Paeniclostridium sp.]
CQKRAKNVLGGFCGFYGACGAGVGCGIYTSLIQESGPMNKEEWGLCNLMTSKSLENISKYGGPRCCKRDSFTAIETAIDFTKEYLNVELDKTPDLKCNFNNLNKECLHTKCKFYNESILVLEEN